MKASYRSISESRRGRDRVVDQRGFVRDTCHPQTGFVHFDPLPIIMRLNHRAGVVAHVDAVEPHPEDGFGKRAGLGLRLHHPGQVREQFGAALPGVRLVVAEVVVVDLSLPENLTRLAKGAIGQGLTEQVLPVAPQV